jgi:hypothetical protein
MKLAAASALLCLVVSTRIAEAEPWFGWGQNKTEELSLSGDLDVEDLVTGTLNTRTGKKTSATHAGTWISVGGFWRLLETGNQDAGLMVIAGVAFDRLAKRQAPDSETPFIGDGTSRPNRAAPPPTTPSPAPPPPIPAPAPTLPPTPAPLPTPSLAPAPDSDRVLVTPSVARRAVTAAWRTAGVGVDDTRVDSMIARARSSAALPEARLRAMRVFLLDGSQPSIVPIDSSSYATTAATLVLEGRLTWRLDRLLFADDEPSLERLRLDREEARGKVAGKVLDALFQWQRAWLALYALKPGTREATDATMRLVEAEAGLDVLTGGWFGAWAAGARVDARSP